MGKKGNGKPRQLALAFDVEPKPRVLRLDELIALFDADDPRVLSGQYNVFGFTPSEWRAYHRKLGLSNGTDDNRRRR